MKNPKTPARLPRKAPSNQTGGTAWGKKLAAEFSRMVQSADMKKLILLNFPFYMVEKAAWLYRHCNGDSVVDRLMGYAIMMVRKVWLWGNTRRIQATRVPHTPRMVSSAGVREMPKPRR